jgi:Big-like domain-containing protein
MLGRFCVRALLLASFAVPFFGCGSSTTVDSIAISPSTVSLGTGNTAQLTAIGTYGHGSHPATNQNITTTVTWASSIAAVATVSPAGVVTGVGAGTTSITASIQGFGGLITSNTAEITVVGSGGGGATGNLTSLSIIPGTQSVASPGQTGQFIAIGTTSSGATENLTGSVTWSSSSKQVATISVGGLATGVSQGTTTITAIATNSDGTVVTGTATFTVTGGTSEPFTAITISPSAEALSATGQTGQFTAIATASGGLQQDVTNSPQVKWSSSIPTIATVTTSPAPSAGTVAGVSPGSTVITATLTNPDKTVLTSSATITVTASSQAEPLLSITILPASVSTGNLYGTTQFLAYGTFSTSPTVQDITNGITRDGFTSPVYWISDLQTEFPVTTASGPLTYPPSTPLTDGGLVTAYATGSTSIYVTATNPDGTLVYSPAVTFACPYIAPTTTDVGSCNQETIADPLLVSLTVFNAGLNPNVTGNWLVTAPSATGTANVIHCGPGSAAAGFGASVCSAPYPIGATITLTTITSAEAGTKAGDGVAFGGWSYNCLANPNPSTATGTNTCTVTLGNDGSPTNPTSNVSVGAIFNNAVSN